MVRTPGPYSDFLFVFSHYVEERDVRVRTGVRYLYDEDSRGMDHDSILDAITIVRNNLNLKRAFLLHSEKVGTLEEFDPNWGRGNIIKFDERFSSDLVSLFNVFGLPFLEYPVPEGEGKIEEVFNLYHVSEIENKDRILEEGIKPSGSIVYLSQNPDSWIKPGGDPSKVIFKVEVTGLQRGRFSKVIDPKDPNSKTSKLDEILYWGTVPAGNVKVYDPNKAEDAE